MKIVDIERYYCLVLRRFRESEGHILLEFSARVPLACLKAWTKSMSIPMTLRRRLMADLIAFKVFYAYSFGILFPFPPLISVLVCTSV